MSAFEVLLPTLMIVGGILLAVYAKQAGQVFCALGRATWRIVTFGRSDMHWFHSEGRVPRTFRIGGVFMAFFGVAAAVLLYLSLHGPNSLAAMRQAKEYLDRTRGDSHGKWSLSCQPANDSSSLDIKYEFLDQKGVLRADWTGDRYSFHENQGAPTPPSADQVK